MKQYKIVTMSIHSDGKFLWPCVQVDFYNQGSTDCYVNGRLVPQNSGFGFTGFPGEQDVTEYNIRFDEYENEGNHLVVTTKQYIN